MALVPLEHLFTLANDCFPIINAGNRCQSNAYVPKRDFVLTSMVNCWLADKHSVRFKLFSSFLRPFSSLTFTSIFWLLVMPTKSR